MNDDATINEKGAEKYGEWIVMKRESDRQRSGRTRILCKSRTRISHNVGTHDRCGTTVEPLITTAVVCKDGRTGETGDRGIKREN